MELLKTEVFWDVSPWRFVTVTDASEGCSASIFRIKHSRKRKLVLWLQDYGVKLVQYVWFLNYRIKNMGQDLKCSFSKEDIEIFSDDQVP